MKVQPPTYDAQLAERAAELLPGIGATERLELLGVMDPDDLRAALAFIMSRHPQVFDHALVRDRRLVERLGDRLAQAGRADEDLAPYCALCGAPIGVFLGQQDKGYQHYRQGTVASRVEIFDAGHEAAVSWAPAGVR